MQISKSNALLINTVSGFLIAFLLIKLCINLLVFILTNHFEIETSYQNFDLLPVTHYSSKNWTFSSVLSIYATWAVVPIIFVFFFFLVFASVKDEKSGYKILPAFLYFTAFLMLSGAIIAGVTTNSVFYHFLNWLYIPHWAMFVMAVFLVLLTVFIGYLFLKDYVIFSESKKVFKKDYQAWFLKKHFALGVGVGIAILLLMRLPTIREFRLYELFEMGIFILALIPVFLVRKKLGKIFVEDHNTESVQIFMPIAAIALIALTMILSIHY